MHYMAIIFYLGITIYRLPLDRELKNIYDILKVLTVILI